MSMIAFTIFSHRNLWQNYHVCLWTKNLFQMVSQSFGKSVKPNYIYWKESKDLCLGSILRYFCIFMTESATLRAPPFLAPNYTLLKIGVICTTFSLHVTQCLDSFRTTSVCMITNTLYIYNVTLHPLTVHRCTQVHQSP